MWVNLESVIIQQLPWEEPAACSRWSWLSWQQYDFRRVVWLCE